MAKTPVKQKPQVTKEDKTKQAPAKTKEAPAPRFCLCGCGTQLKGKKSNFAIGHDMKVKSAIATNLKQANSDLFAGVDKGAVAYAKEKWADYIGGLVKKYTEKPAVKAHADLKHFNPLHYMSQLS